MPRGPAAPLLVAVGLLLSGCSTVSSPTPTPTPTAAAMPSVPLLPGTVVARTASPGEWHVWVRAEDPEEGYREARRLIQEGGFTLTKDRPGHGGGDGQACTARLCVGFTGRDDPAFGPTLEYEVFLPATAGAP